MSTLDELRARVEARIAAWLADLPGGPLYEPMAYLMRLPAKRVRPVAVLLGCELFGGRADDALDEALGIELFHNFTLMHDDIMDGAPLRRGQPTVHVKWNVNTAILSGDAMLVEAYEHLLGHPGAARIFGRHAALVCQGQQLDMDFERRHQVSLHEYTEMIRLKTAVLLGCALQVGAEVAGAPSGERERLGRVGEHTGLAFQLRDDLLDAFGDPDKVGKQRGGDLRAGKKTWLLIRGLAKADAIGDETLRTELAKPAAVRDVEAMIAALHRLGVDREAEAEIARHDAEAALALEALAVPQDRKMALSAFMGSLKARAY